MRVFDRADWESGPYAPQPAVRSKGRNQRKESSPCSREPDRPPFWLLCCERCCPVLTAGPARRQERSPMTPPSSSPARDVPAATSTTRSMLTDEMLARFSARAPRYDRDNTFFTEDFDE